MNTVENIDICNDKVRLTSNTAVNESLTSGKKKRFSGPLVTAELTYDTYPIMNSESQIENTNTKYKTQNTPMTICLNKSYRALICSLIFNNPVY